MPCGTETKTDCGNCGKHNITSHIKCAICEGWMCPDCIVVGPIAYGGEDKNVCLGCGEDM